MFLGMQDFDFCSKFYQQILSNLSKLTQILPKFAQIYLKKFAKGCGRILCITTHQLLCH